MGQVITTSEDRDRLQEALNELSRWANTWGMAFNTKKCKVKHIGNKNPRQKYKMDGVELTETVEERDIGVIVSSSLKPAAQFSKAVRTALAVLGPLTRLSPTGTGTSL